MLLKKSFGRVAEGLLHRSNSLRSSEISPVKTRIRGLTFADAVLLGEQWWMRSVWLQSKDILAVGGGEAPGNSCNEFYRTVFRKKVYSKSDDLQTDPDDRV